MFIWRTYSHIKAEFPLRTVTTYKWLLLFGFIPLFVSIESRYA